MGGYGSVNRKFGPTDEEIGYREGRCFDDDLQNHPVDCRT